MSIISVEMMKTIDETEMKKTTTKEKQIKTGRCKGIRSYSKIVSAKFFCCSFKLGFLQVICKDSLIFKMNLELGLSNVFKQREVYESKHVAMECRSLKILYGNLK